MTIENEWFELVQRFTGQPESPFINMIGKNALEGNFPPEEAVDQGDKIDLAKHFASRDVNRLSLVINQGNKHRQVEIINGDDGVIYLVYRDLHQESNPDRTTKVGNVIAEAFVVDTKKARLLADAVFLKSDGTRSAQQYAHFEYMQAKDEDQMLQLYTHVCEVLEDGEVVFGYDASATPSNEAPVGPQLSVRG